MSTAINCIQWADLPSEVDKPAGSNPSVIYSNIQNPGGIAYRGTSNINADPLFLSATPGNYRISAASPWMNTGSPIWGPATDMLEVPRPQGAGVDMGVYAVPTLGSDGDPIPNLWKPDGDADGDILPNYLDSDSDGDGLNLVGNDATDDLEFRRETRLRPSRETSSTPSRAMFCLRWIPRPNSTQRP